MNVGVICYDTDGAHTFTINAPTGPNGTTQITQLNETVPGQHIYYPPAQPGPKYGTTEYMFLLSDNKISYIAVHVTATLLLKYDSL